MKLTQKIIQQELEELKKQLIAGDVEIPSLWACAWPGLIIFLWLVFLPYLTFGIYDNYSEDGIQSMGIGAFWGFMLLVITMNSRSFFLSLPVGFRETSKTVRLLRDKGFAYIGFILIIATASAWWAPKANGGSLVYALPMILSSVILLFIFLADIGRYRLSAFTSAMELLKSRKQGDE